jgi:hypothetical protein
MRLADTAHRWRKDSDMNQKTGTWVGKRLRGLIVDMHIGGQDPEFLSGVDPEKMADTIAAAHVNFVLVYAKSHWGLCLYPTRIGKMHPGIKGRDFFGEMVKALHERGIKAVCYLTVAWEEFSAGQHPEWLQRDYKGTVMECPALRESDAAWKFLCIRSPYREIVLGHLRELVESYPVDGVFLDITASGGSGCWCRYCQDAFKKKTGRKIPLSENWKDPLFRQFAAFSQATWTEFMAEARALVDEIKPGLPVTNNFTMAPFSWRLSHRISETGKYVTYGDTENHPDSYGFGGLTFISKLARAAVEFGPVDNLFGRYHGHWDYTIKPTAQAQVEVSAALATGASATYIDHVWPDGTLEPAVYDFIGQVYAGVKEKEEWVIDSVPVLHTGLLFSERNRDMVGARNAAHYLVSVCGLARVLAEEHFPFDLIMDKHLRPDMLSRFKVLMLPSCRYLADAEVKAIKEFVDRGGTLVSSGELALGRDDFFRREKSPMEDLIGGTFLDTFSSPCYISFTPEELPGEDRVTSYPVPHPRQASRLKPESSVRALGKIIEGYPSRTKDVPWITHGLATPHKNTDHPFILINTYGRGKSIYFAGDPGAVYGERSFEEMRVLIRHVLGQEITWPVRVSGPSCVELTWLRQAGANREIIHILNFQPETGRPIFSFQDTGTVIRLPFGLRSIGNMIARRIDRRVRPRLMKMIGPDFLASRQPPHIIKEVLPVFDIVLHYRLPADTVIKNIYLAPERKAPEIVNRDGELIIRIPRLDCHTMVVLER